MSLLGFLLLLVVAAIIGTIGQALAGYSVGGCIASIILGFVGAYLGFWLARVFDLPIFFAVQVVGRSFPLIWSIIGAALLTLAIGLFTRRRRSLL